MKNYILLLITVLTITIASCASPTVGTYLLVSQQPGDNSCIIRANQNFEIQFLGENREVNLTVHTDNGEGLSNTAVYEAAK